MSVIMSRRDLEFLLYEWLDVEALTTRERYADHSRETFDGVLGLSERLATDLFAPHNRAADLEEPTWDGQDVHLLQQPQIPTVFVTPQPVMIPDVPGVLQVQEPLRASDVAHAVREAVTGFALRS